MQCRLNSRFDNKIADVCSAGRMKSLRNGMDLTRIPPGCQILHIFHLSFSYLAENIYFCNMTPISATIIARNEEQTIAHCLESLEGIADEIIVVVDDSSTDRTAEISRDFGCRVVIREFRGFGAQRQYATSLTTHRHILSIDADEVLSPYLRENLLKAKEEGLKHRVYRFSRMNFYCDFPVLHCGWYPDFQIRLFDKSYAQWNLGDVFEKVVFPGSLRPRLIEGDILHYRCATADEYHRKVMDHARIGARVIASTRNSVPAVLPLIKGIKSWMETFVFRGGFLDGKVGRAIAREEYHSTKAAYTEAKAILESDGKNQD